ncbi:MAG: hypothetical protein ABFD64_08345 [Armatimonadota bacterium]
MEPTQLGDLVQNPARLILIIILKPELYHINVWVEDACPFYLCPALPDKLWILGILLDGPPISSGLTGYLSI